MLDRNQNLYKLGKNVNDVPVEWKQRKYFMVERNNFLVEAQTTQWFIEVDVVVVSDFD